jgi:2-furoate---CoA ligase
MLDLGTTWLATVARDPDALAIVDGHLRLRYGDWHERVAGMAAGFAAMELEPGDHLVTLLQTRWEAATAHLAAQLAGLIHVPLDFATNADDLAAVLEDCGAPALIYQPDARAALTAPHSVTRICLGTPTRGEIAFEDLLEEPSSDVVPQVGPDAWSVLFYSHFGRLSRGIPRRHRAQRAAAFAHVAHNQYGAGERTLGAIPLWQEPGLRALLSSVMIGGTFVCQRSDDPAHAIALIERERISALALDAESFACVLEHPAFAETDVSSVRRLCVYGEQMPPELAHQLDATFRPVQFISQYGCPEIPGLAVNREPLLRPDAAGRAGYDQLVRVVCADAVSPDDQAAPGEVGRVIALLSGDDAFEGYWHRPEADRIALQEGWFLTEAVGFYDAAGELYITGHLALDPPDEEPAVLVSQFSAIG